MALQLIASIAHSTLGLLTLLGMLALVVIRVLTTALQVLQELHRRYDGLWQELAVTLDKALEAGMGCADSAAVLQRRALLKLAADIDAHGIAPMAARLQPHISQLVCLTSAFGVR